MKNKRHCNRHAQQDKLGRGKVKNNTRPVDKHSKRTRQGEVDLANDRRVSMEYYDLDWFQPTDAQMEVIESAYVNDLTAIQGATGTGKTTLSVWLALKSLNKGYYKTVLFVKTPEESGDDQIGFLKGDANEKLEVHFEGMRSIFTEFMTKEKLQMDEKKGKIKFDVPNYMKGKTYTDTLMIIDESQSLSPQTVSMILERAGEGTMILLLGDKRQRYAIRNRPDGFTYFIDMMTYEDVRGNKVTNEDFMGYVEMTAVDNVRSRLSRRVTEMFEEAEDDS